MGAIRYLILMQGIPGSGKSFIAQILFDRFKESGDAAILSTDDFWYDAGDVYRFDPARIADAHRWNQRRTVEHMQAGFNYLIIDNTNITEWEAAPYLALAKIFDYTVQVIGVDVELDEAKRQNRQRPYDRRIPDDVLESKFRNRERLVNFAS